MNRGYIRVWRKIEDSGIMGNPEVCRLFLYLMLKAAAKPRKQMIGNSLVPLLPGQIIVGRKVLAAELGTTEGKIRSCLAALQKMEIIRQQPTNKFTIISLVNWGIYQNGAGGESRQNANKQPAINQVTTTNKNEEINNTSTNTPANSPAQSCCGEQIPPCAAPRGANAALPQSCRAEGTSAGAAPRSATAPGGSGGSVADVPIEFLELRKHYDQHAREEAPGTGVSEYWRLKSARTWPGLDVILDAVEKLAAHDDAWKRGYAPGLGKFLREKQWQKKPTTVKSVMDKAPGGATQGGDPTIMANLNTAAKLLAKRR